MSKKEILKKCLNYRCSLKIQTLREKINLRKNKIFTKSDCKTILNYQKQIFALKNLIKMDWNETVENISSYDFFNKNFEFKKIADYSVKKSENFKNLFITTDKAVDEYWSLVKMKKGENTLKNYENRLNFC